MAVVLVVAVVMITVTGVTVMVVMVVVIAMMMLMVVKHLIVTHSFNKYLLRIYQSRYLGTV